MLKFIIGLTTGALLTLTGLAAAATFGDREPVSGVDVLEDACLESAARFHRTIEDIEKKEKAKLDALREDLRKRMEVATATATASETAAEPASDSPVENAES